MSKKPPITTPPEPSKEQEYLAGWQRARAELDNFRKRMVAQEAQQRQYMMRDTVAPLLELADNFEAVIRHVPKEIAGDPWVLGVLHVARQLEGILADMGVSPIDQTQVPFDPAIHEAIEQADSAVTDNKVKEIVRKGYKVGDTVIRPAQVKV